MRPTLRRLHGHKKRTSHMMPLNIRYFAIGLAIVMFWRGSWRIMDYYFFPGYPLLSHLLCIVIALMIFLSNDGKLDELGKL